MEPLTSTILSAIAKAVAGQLGKQLATPALRRLLGDPRKKAFERALRRAYDSVQAEHGQTLSYYDVSLAFLAEHEGAAELAKVIVPGARPSANVLARACIASLGRRDTAARRTDEARLEPVFAALLAALTDETLAEKELSGLAGRNGVAVADAEAAYLRWVGDSMRFIRTEGLVRNIVSRPQLDEVFVGLSARAEPTVADWERARLNPAVEPALFEGALDRIAVQAVAREEAQTQPVLKFARSKRHLVVLGDPGAGKTTLLRFLALRNADAMLDHATVDGRAPRLPIYVRVGDFARSPDRRGGIGGFLGPYLRGHGCPSQGLDELFAVRLRAGRCLVLLDGLDEIASAAERRSMVDAVTEFVTANTRQGNWFIVSSRISGYQAAPLPQPFTTVRLQDMDDEAITAFLGRYDPRGAVAIEQAIRSTPGVRRLAANPLLLTALVLVHQSYGNVPRWRAEAYAEVCDALTARWRAVQGVPTADLPDELLVRNWLTRLGAWLHEHRPEGSATLRELLEVLGPIWAKDNGRAWDPQILRSATDWRDDPIVARLLDFVDLVERQTGLLVERAPGRYGFAHLTFEEYYAARALAYGGNATDRVARIRQHLHDPRYDEPILLALGLVSRDQRAHPEQSEHVDELVIDAIWPEDEPSEYEDVLGRDFLFLLRVLADDPPLKTSTLDPITETILDLWISPDEGPTRYRLFREQLQERVTALRGTSAAAQLKKWLAEVAQKVVEPKPGVCEVARFLAPLGRPGPVTVAYLTRALASADDQEVRLMALDALVTSGAVDGGVIAEITRLAKPRSTATSADRPFRVAPGGLTVWPLVIPGYEAAGLLAGLVQDLIDDKPVPFDRTELLSWLAAGGPYPEPIRHALARLAGTVDNDHDRVQIAIASAKGASYSDDAVTVLTGVTRSPVGNARPRYDALKALAEAGTAAALRALADLAAAGEDQVRLDAAELVAEHSPPSPQIAAAIADLALSTADRSARVHALALLAMARDLTADEVSFLVQAARDAQMIAAARYPRTAERDAIDEAIEESWTRAIESWAVEALGRNNRHEDLRKLVLRPGTTDLRITALNELDDSDLATTVALSTDDPQLQAFATHIATTSDAIVNLAAKLIQTLTGEADEMFRSFAVYTLMAAPPTTAQTRLLLDVLVDQDAVRAPRVAAAVLARWNQRDPEIETELLHLLDTSRGEPDIVYEAFWQSVTSRPPR